MTNSKRQPIPDQALADPIWDRATQEPDRAFSHFQHYRDLGPRRRSIRKVAQDHNIGSASIGITSSRWRWRERVHAYDAAQDRENQVARNQIIVEMQQRHAQGAMDHLDVLAEPARVLAERIEHGRLDLEGLSDADLIRLTRDTGRVLDRIQKAERLARGEPTTIIERLEADADWDDDLDPGERRDALLAVRDALLDVNLSGTLRVVPEEDGDGDEDVDGDDGGDT